MKSWGVIGLWCAALAATHGYDFIGISPTTWPDGPIPMDLQLDTTMTPQPLSDGKGSWNAVATEALGIWNAELDRVQFTTLSGGTRRDGNNKNEVFFSSNVYGHRFGSFVLAVTTVWRSGRQRVEGDTIFNTAMDWDSYRGDLDREPMDLRRVAIHEFGHTLGLDHPDRARQVEVAIMNSTISDLDTIALDDIRGVRALYPPNTSYILDVVIDPPESGGVFATPAPDINGRYPAGTVVTLTPRPDRRNRFNAWTGDRIKKNRVLRLQVVGDETIVAHFSTNTAPRITLQPQSQFAHFSETVTFSVRAVSGTAVQYQWEMDGSDVPGATSPDLSLNFVTHADSGVYSCRLTNAHGESMSKAARLVVDGY
jgi:hypothetical protein